MQELDSNATMSPHLAIKQATLAREFNRHMLVAAIPANASKHALLSG